MPRVYGCIIGVIADTMKAFKEVFSMLMVLGTVYADSVTSSFNIDNVQKYVDNVELSLPALNASDIPAWVDEWKPPKVLREQFPLYISGYDFEGSPVYVMEFGHWKMAEAIRSNEDGPETGFKLFMKYHDQVIYRIYQDGQARNGQGIVIIIDFDGFAISNYASPLALKAGLNQLATLEHIYNVLNYAFFINTNFAAENFIRLGKPLMGNYLDKCEVFGSQKYKWLPHLARKIPTSQLAPWYGGPKDWQPLTIGLEPFNSTSTKTT